MMKCLDRVWGGIVLGVLVMGLSAAGWDNAAPVFKGTTPMVAKITASSNTGTALWTGGMQRMDTSCRLNGAGPVWIGTVSAQANGYEHPNITNGVFQLSSETFKLDGLMSGVLYMTCNPGTASCEARCLYGNVSR